MPGGFEQATLTLPRKPAREYARPRPAHHPHLLRPRRRRRVAGRLERAPRVSGDQMAVSPAAVGWQAHLEDDKSAEGDLRGPGPVAVGASMSRAPGSATYGCRYSAAGRAVRGARHRPRTTPARRVHDEGDPADHQRALLIEAGTTRQRRRRSHRSSYQVACQNLGERRLGNRGVPADDERRHRTSTARTDHDGRPDRHAAPSTAAGRAERVLVQVYSTPRWRRPPHGSFSRVLGATSRCSAPRPDRRAAPGPTRRAATRPTSSATPSEVGAAVARRPTIQQSQYI